MGLLSGRSHHGVRRSRPSSSIALRTSSKRKDDEQVEDITEAPKPGLEELRTHRSAYYSLSDQERRRLSSQNIPQARSRSSNVSSSRSATTSDRRHRRRHRSSSSRDKDKAEQKSSRSHDVARQRPEEYVYSSRPSPGLEPIVEEPQPEHRRSERRHSKHSSSVRRSSLPTVIEAEITPDDSISQIGDRDPPRYHRTGAYVRPSLRRSSTTSAKLRTVPEKPRDTRSATTTKRSSRAAPSVSAPTPVRRHSTTSVPDQPKLVDCLTCGADDVPASKSAKLVCGHRMCHDCLKRVFEMSVKDPAHMPPKCCGEEHIPLKHVEKLFDIKFKMHWNLKYQEFHTKNRIYCPVLKCGEWIKPSQIHTEKGRKCAVCPRCKTKVCPSCNGKMHKSTECPNDPEIAKLVEQAKEKGWQRCYSCNAFVEKKEGCNHMTCRCLAEFCIVCGSKWKTCDCPWFNYHNLPNPDRLNDMRIPEPVQHVFRHVFRDALNPIPPPPPRGGVPGEFPRGPAPEVTYQQEMDNRHRQERLDEDLARRLQLQTLLDPDDFLPPRWRGHDIDLVGLGNAARNFMNDDYAIRNAANVVMGAFGDANLGRRGERASGRRRRPRNSGQNNGDPEPAQWVL
jgi:hypothetical protein